MRRLRMAVMNASWTASSASARSPQMAYIWTTSRRYPAPYSASRSSARRPPPSPTSAISVISVNGPASRRCAEGDALDLPRDSSPLVTGAPVAELLGDDPVTSHIEDPPVGDVPGGHGVG